MSFFVSRAVTPGGQDRADVFARGATAVLVVADGAGGVGDGGTAADMALAGVRDAVLDASFDLLAPTTWSALFGTLDRAIAGKGETTLVVVVRTPGMMVCATAGDSEAWMVHASVVRLSQVGPRLGSRRVKPHTLVRGDLEGRLVVASDGLFRHVAADVIANHLRTAPWSGLSDSLVELARLPSGEFSDDVAVLVAER